MTLEHQRLIDAMTLEEKISLLSGADFWNTKAIDHLGIPAIMLTDGPHGLRKQAGKADHLGLNKSVPATCFPTASALANTWDESLLERVGRALGSEAAANGVSVLLGPGLNIVRDPLAGRTFEYFSEDPYVAGKLAAAMVRGIQQNGVVATPKHFAVNSQEHLRMSIDEVVDERTLREVYLEGFRRVVQEAKPKLIMTSYNKVNSTYSNENPHLLQDILKNEWGYEGALVTDWGGNHDRVDGLINGNTLDMPSSNGLSEEQIGEAVRVGKVDESVVDAHVDALLTIVFETTEAIKQAPPADYEAHHKLAVEAAVRSIVLLKNDTNVLPLAKGTRVALIGDFAEMPRYQGAGSSLVNPTRLVGLKEAFSFDDSIELLGYEPGFKRAGGKSSKLARRAVELAKKAEVVIVCVGLDESKEAEGLDRPTMALAQNQLNLIKTLASSHEKVVVITAAGGPIEMPFADDVTAVVHSSLGGQGIGTALADIVTGRRNPSGKLAVSYPLTYNDAPTARYFPGKEKTAEHREGLYVGYRYYETTATPVRYPFGYGLSYTTFSYANATESESGVTFTITNNGPIAGEEIAQVYIRPPQSDIFRPLRELKGFVKVALEAGETKEVSVHFDEHTFAYYDEKVADWAVVGGEYTVEIAASSQDIRLEISHEVEAKNGQMAYDKNQFVSYYSGDIKNVPDDEFEALLGRPIPPARWNRKTRLGYDDTILQLQYRGLFARILYGFLKLMRTTLLVFRKQNTANNIVFIINMPFSKLPGFSGGAISEKTIKRLLGIKKHE